MTTHSYLNDQIITIDNFISCAKCHEFIEKIDNEKIARNFTNSGNFTNRRYVDNDLSQWFYKLLVNALGAPLADKLKIKRANELIMTGKYDESQEFGLHTDTGAYYDRVLAEKSNYTLLIYLNDDYDGGTTAFFDDKFNPILDIVPKKGMALLFDIDLWHQGNKVVDGTKYWIGCEIIGSFANQI
uniref:Prolyl 4-hydroxylase alpha subunit domain-containing protein n=1 Tax=viral metagenome TaxID=1070528 RepID=A0A6C0C8W6_9ZZZZ